MARGGSEALRAEIVARIPAGETRRCTLVAVSENQVMLTAVIAGAAGGFLAALLLVRSNLSIG